MRQRVHIEASAGDIWPFVADPAVMATWNPNIVRVDRAAAGALRTSVSC